MLLPSFLRRGALWRPTFQETVSLQWLRPRGLFLGSMDFRIADSFHARSSGAFRFNALVLSPVSCPAVPAPVERLASAQFVNNLDHSTARNANGARSVAATRTDIWHT